MTAVHHRHPTVRRLVPELGLGIGLSLALASCAGPSAPAQQLGGDVPDAVGARPIDPSRSASLIARAQGMVRPGSVVQTDARLGVPTFLWAREPRVAASPGQWLRSGSLPAVAASRAALADYASLYGLSGSDVDSAVVAQVHDLGKGPILVKYRGEVGGVEVFREELNVVMDRTLKPVALSGYISGAATPATRSGLDFQLSAAAGASNAVAHLARTAIDAAQLVPAGSHDGYDHFTLTTAAGVPLDEPIRVKKVLFHLPEGLEPAYYVEVYARTGTAVGTISADGSPVAAPEAYSYVVSAATGQLLFRKNLIAEAVGRDRSADALPAGGFTYRVWADPVTGIPLDTPAGNGIDPKIDPVPDGVQYPFLATSDITLPNFPFSKNDPWLAAGATETVGNNVDAFLNLFSPDGLTPVAPPSDPASGDFRAELTAPGQFLHSQLPDDLGAHGPSLAEGRQGAIQQLFYNINFLHDWYYDSGFNEAAGNAQTDNFGRGGVQGDSIKGQAQDFSGFSNANMATGADGNRPRMRMYVFPSPANHVEVTSTALSGSTGIGIFMSGPQSFDVTGDAVVATFAAAPGCTVTNAAALDGKVALFDFDNTDGTGCAFGARLTQLEGTTAGGILMVYTVANPNAAVNVTGFNPNFNKPFASISNANGGLIKQALQTVAVTLRLFRAPDRDGAIDQQIVFHEFFHYVSNRLVGNGAGLGTNHAGGMGEGWSDFSSMLLTVREDDALVPSNANWNGVYSLASYATSGVPFTGAQNQGYYFGIRRYPYSTDLSKNPLTFKHITNGVALPVGPAVGFGADGASNAEVHNTGEVWTTMLWEGYAALLRDTLGATPRLTFQQAQDRMKLYVIGGLKATPTFPTFTEARDGILSVALANDPADYIALLGAFAKRGAGAHAVSPDRFSQDNAGVVEDFSVGPDLSFVGATLDDSLGSCDNDGVLDRGEFGKLTITLRNTGTTALTQTTATVSSTSPDIWFPDGPSVTFPTVPLRGTASASVRVAYGRNATGIQQVDFQIQFGDPQLAGAQTTTVGFRTNTDETAAASATDTVEATASAWTAASAAGRIDAAPWHRVQLSPLDHAFHADDAGTTTDEFLISPALTVDAGGHLTLAFDHAWGFETDGTNNFDGGVIEMSVNGGAFADIGASAYNGTLTSGTGNPLQGKPAFVKSSTGTIHTVLTPTAAAGSVVKIRFRAVSDGAAGAVGWTIDNLAFTGVVETPFAQVVPEGDTCTRAPGSADLAITVDDGATSVRVGNSVTYTISAANVAGDDLPGAIVSDTFPADATCTWTCTASAGASCAAAGSGNIADRINLPAGGTAVYSAVCAVSATTASTQLVNTASVAAPGPVADPVTGNNTATDTDQILRLPAHLTATKTVAGSFVQGGTVTYTIALANDSGGKQFDNAGDELTDVLPAGLTLVSAAATSGTAVATVATNTVTWNGNISAGAGVTITIVATINAAAGTTISNQAAFKFDADGDALNESSGSTEGVPCPSP
jgi:large repetitive protein